MPLPEHLQRLLAESTVETYRSSGPGGQKKNKTESSVRVRHVPTGISRVATESRSQTRNKEMALERLWNALQARARKPKPRLATKPTGASRRERVESKRRTSETKRLRGRPGDE
jgi:protein subunit release factor A